MRKFRNTLPSRNYEVTLTKFIVKDERGNPICFLEREDAQKIGLMKRAQKGRSQRP